MGLDRYRSMRDFGATPEPEPAEVPEISEHERAGRPRFVVQEHHATSLHWDLRLERGGVLASWAVPKGIPPDPRVNNLAVHTEDHPLLYLDFEGEIPEGSYGAGKMTIWDRGTYETHKFDDREVMVTLHGERARGRYVLFRTEGNQWMIHRMDPAEDPTREPMPSDLRPMLATPGPLPADPESWAFEVLWGGARTVVSSEGGRARATEPDGRDVTARWPELRELGRSLGTLAVVLDGEVVVLGPDGRPDAERLEHRRRASSESAVRRLARSMPAVYLVFDLLWLEGHHTTSLPYAERRRLLDELELDGPAWRVPPSHVGEGDALLAAARAQGLPGIVAKRLDSPYAPGTRTPAWVEIPATGDG